MPDYYPRAKLRLILRLDEFGDVAGLKARTPTKSTKNLNGITSARSPLVAQLDPDAPAGVARYVLTHAEGDLSNTSPQARTQSSDGRTHAFELVPHELSWQQNGVRVASTLRASIRYVDCPFDPRLIAACGVVAFLGTVSEDAAAALLVGGDALPDTYTGPYGEARTNKRFEGFVDTWEDGFTKDGEPMVQLTARDNIAMLLEQECPPRLVIGAKKPIHQAIADYLANFVQFEGLTVEYRPAGEDPPVLADVLSGTAYRPNLGPQPAKGGGASTNKLSVLDYVTDVVRCIGHTVRMDGTALIVQRARALMTSSLEVRPDDPFRPRDDGAPVRRLIYGKNLLELRPKRQFSKHTPTNVEVRCYNTERKKDLVARFPLPADRQVYALPGNTKPDEKWLVHEVSGIKDVKVLRAIAQGIYEEIGRHEIGAQLSTSDLSSFGGGNDDPDLLDMKVGDTVELLVAQSDDEASTVTNIEKVMLAQARAAELLRLLGFETELADAYAKAASDAEFLTQFRMRGMRVDWNVDEGIKIAGTVINYIQVRADKLLPGKEEPVNTAAR